MEAMVILVGWVFSVCCHEYAHAIVAWHGGDKSVEEKGYLDFNPFAYVHPMTSIVLPIVFLLMGGVPLMGGAVWIDHSRIRNRHWDSAVSAAGPLADIVLALLLCVPFALGLADPESSIWQIAAVLIHLNLFVSFLNLLPIPGVDGFGIIRPYLSLPMQQKSDEIAQFGIIILFVLLRVPAINVALWLVTMTVEHWLGVPMNAVKTGMEFLDVLRLPGS